LISLSSEDGTALSAGGSSSEQMNQVLRYTNARSLMRKLRPPTMQAYQRSKKTKTKPPTRKLRAVKLPPRSVAFKASQGGGGSDERASGAAYTPIRVGAKERHKTIGGKESSTKKEKGGASGGKGGYGYIIPHSRDNLVTTGLSFTSRKKGKVTANAEGDRTDRLGKFAGQTSGLPKPRAKAAQFKEVVQRYNNTAHSEKNLVSTP